MLGFDNEKYIKLQSEKILERISNSSGKLYLEFGGKLFDDYNAERVLPGFKHNTKIKMLEQLKDKLEIVVCINAKDIEKNKIRSDYGITYEQDVLRLIDELTNLNFKVSSVVITQYKNGLDVNNFKYKLQDVGINVYIHPYIEGYSTDIDFLLSDARLWRK